MSAEIINQLLTPLIFATFAVGFATIWFQYRNLKSAGFFAIAYMCGTVGFLFEVVLPDINEFSIFLLRAIGDKFYLLITLFTAIAIAYRFNAPVPKKLLATIMLVGASTNLWFWFVVPDLVIRSYVLTFSCAAMLLTCLPIIEEKKRHMLDKILFWLIGISALQLVLNTVVILHILNEMITLGNFWQSTFLALLNFSVSIISLSLAVALFVGFGMDIIAVYREKSDTDVLSGVLNRRGFEFTAAEVVTKSGEIGTPVTLIVADIDHFKEINDTFGHDVGDDAIKNFATILKTACRANDIVGRVGGEEFCILLPSATQEMGGLIAEAIRTTLSGFDHGNSKTGPLLLTSSFGVAELRPGETYLGLFRRADAALYAAKQSGRDQVRRADLDDETRVKTIRQKLA